MDGSAVTYTRLEIAMVTDCTALVTTVTDQ